IAIAALLVCARAPLALAQDDPFDGNLRTLYAQEDAEQAHEHIVQAAHEPPPSYSAARVVPVAPPDPPPTHEDAVLFGATSLGGALITDQGVAETFSFAMRIGGPHYGRADAGTRVFSVDLGLARVEANGMHSTLGTIDVRDYLRFDRHVATYVL